MKITPFTHLGQASLALLLAGTLSSTAFATTVSAPGVVAGWDLRLEPHSDTNPTPGPTDIADGVTVSDLAMHGSVTSFPSGRALQYEGFGSSIDLSNYVGFTLTPTAGEQLDLTGFAWIQDGDGGLTGTGTSYTFGYRVNGGSWTLDATQFFSNGSAFETWTFDQPIVTSGSVEFGWFVANSSPTGIVSPTLDGNGDDMTVKGTVIPTTVPEPSSVAGGIIATLAMIVLFRRKARAV